MRIKLLNVIDCDANMSVLSLQSVLRPEALSELLMFKGELETEIKSLQKAMNSQEEESSISQISRLLGQVTKLEYQLKDKEEECKKLMTELSTCQTKSLDSQIQGRIGSQGAGNATEDGSKVDFQSQVCVNFAARNIDHLLLKLSMLFRHI